ncbi:hypothetical protein GCM10027299_13160 [Larkinella ripae]
MKPWIQQTTPKNQMRLNLKDFPQTGSKAVLTVEVTGTFPGSPAVMQHHFELTHALIRSLRITE